MSTKKLCTAAVLLAAWCGGATHAEDKGFYVGASGGVSQPLHPPECSDLAGFVSLAFDSPGPSSCSSDTATFGWKVFAGYRINEFLALETSYVDLGKFKISASGTSSSVPLRTSVNSHATGFGADWVGFLPISPGFALMARVGAFAWTLDAPLSVTLGSSSSTIHFRPTGTSLELGAGAQYDFSRNFGARLEFQRFKDVGDDATTGRTDVNLISAGLAFRFN